MEQMVLSAIMERKNSFELLMKLNLFSLRPGPYNEGIKLVLQHLNTSSIAGQQILFVEAAKLKKKF
jgi:hypothetical protein